MQFRIPCKCGKSLRLQPGLCDTSLTCPKCGSESTVVVPTAGIPAPLPAVEAEPSLPTWTVPLMLVSLVPICAMIVLVSWLIVAPSTRVVIVPDAFVHAPVRDRGEQTIKTLNIANPSKSVEPAVEEDDVPLRAPIQLQRRMPAGIEELAPQPFPMPEQQRPVIRSVLQWSVEEPIANVVNLTMPIEIARQLDVKVPHTIRRLRFSDETPKPLRLAVTPMVHDDLGSVLTRMGEGYRFSSLRNEDLLSESALKKHDVVFLTCADLYAQDFQVAVPLRKFVQQGGTLYASDLRGDLILAAFPEFRARTPILPGVPQNIEASVADKGLRSYLGRRTIPLNFEAPDWRPAAFDPLKVSVCLKGSYRNNLGQTLIAPLLVKFQCQKGTVIFTSFHHSRNDSQIVRKLLEYMVFSSVNARSEARLQELMRRSQFAPHEMRPVVLGGDQNIEAGYQHAGGGLQIALGFENLGAKLKLTLRSPSGQSIEHEDRGLYQIEIPGAEAGEWRYMIAPVELPYANFPIVVAIGESKS